LEDWICTCAELRSKEREVIERMAGDERTWLNMVKRKSVIVTSSCIPKPEENDACALDVPHP